MSVYETNKWKLVDLNWNAAVHQDSEKNPICKTNW